MPLEMEMRVVGSHLTGRINGRTIVEAEDTLLRDGALGVGFGATDQTLHVEALEYLKLAQSGISSSAATRDAPFVNSLGMKFVPVPITGGPTSGQRVLFSVWETRVQDIEAFTSADGRPKLQSRFKQGPTEPAVNVSWDNAQAFCVWLTESERRAGKIGPSECYRLPSDHEWSCAAGLGEREDPARSPAEKSGKIPGSYPWGNQWPPPPGAANVRGEEGLDSPHWKEAGVIAGYRDPFPLTAPVGSFAPNAFGLYDLIGNAWEWCEDSMPPNSEGRIKRGNSFSRSGQADASSRGSSPRRDGGGDNGFRVVLAPVP
jgi:formylglycine-generating enzyme required for sulfatase activity